MKDRVKAIIKNTVYPLYRCWRSVEGNYCLKHPMQKADQLFYQKFGRYINWNDPQDINEKINWLKFHADQREWAQYADKYAVRDYVTKRGCAHLLVPLYGKWDTVEALIDDWESLPEEFVLKSNNGCGRVLIVSKENGGKDAAKKILYKKCRLWLQEHNFGLKNTELHYQFIDNCIIAEKLLKDDSVKSWSRSLVDYKIWCFDGKAFGCLVVYDRAIGTTHHYFDYYDLNWEEHTDWMSDKTPRHPIPKPSEWNLMISAAETLSKGFPQVRVDFYNINGEVYYGEMTLTSNCGFMDYFSPELNLELGKQINLDFSMPWNEFAEKAYLRKINEEK